MSNTTQLDGEAHLRISRAVERFDEAWQRGEPFPLEDLLRDAAGLERAELIRHTLVVELTYRRDRGESPTVAEYEQRFPEDGAILGKAFAESETVAPPPGPTNDPFSPDGFVVSPPRPLPGTIGKCVVVHEHGLILGLLAFQNNFIDREALLAAFTAWVANKARPLGQILVDRGSLDPECLATLEALAKQHLKRHGDDVEKSLAGLGALGAVRADLEHLHDPDLNATLSLLGDPAPDAADPFVTLPPPAVRSWRYTLSHLQAEGGLGKVWVACDRDLNREVALKEIRPDQALHPIARSRFLKEAQVTGQLEHPNIVPVYELSRRPEDDQPFYTMRLIRGRTLRQAIAEYHQRRREGQADPLDFQKLLGAFIAVGHAIEYAHARGVVHRDLKPSNVMVGSFGEVIVLDWGLAKTIEASAIRISDEAGTPPTMGQMGTPAYMAPEQVEASQDRIDARTDVYGLGAILFEIVTGRPPHAGRSSAEVLRKILDSGTPRARAVEPTAPRPLEAICARAMAKEPADRYSSAAKLADDVQRWIADEPVSVYRDSLPTRFVRWSRRHVRLASGLATSLATAVVAVSLVAVLVNRERARTEAQRVRAEGNFHLALDAADRMLTEVGDVDLADVPQMEPVRRRLLALARESYARFLAQRADAAEVRAGAGHAEGRLGNILEMLGEYAASERAYRRSIELLASLASGAPGTAAYARDLAYAYHGRGVLRKRENRLREAEADLAEAIRLRRALARATFSEEDRRALADSRYQLGTVLARLPGRRHEQEQAYREAIETQSASVAWSGARSEDRVALGRYLNNLGMLLAPDRPDEAEARFKEALQIEQSLVKESPGLPGPRWQLGRAANNLGTLLVKDDGRRDEGEGLLQHARERLDSLAAEFPNVPQYRRELASIHYNLALAERSRGGRPEAERDLRRALDLLKRLVAEFPEIPEHRQKATDASIQLNILVAESDHDAERLVRKALADALAEQERFVAEFPEIPEYAAVLGCDYYKMGRILAGRRDWDGAVRFLDCAIAHHQAVAAADPANPTFRSYLGEDLVVLAYTRVEQGNLAEAAEAAEELPRLLPDDLQRHGDAAAILLKCAQAAANDPLLAAYYLGQAVQVLALAVTRRIATPEWLDDPTFAQLHGRNDFEELREGLRGKRGATTLGVRTLPSG
jgi:tetratricopeptide (TPR) repeat protein/tRNA A-37 threonylcarbamoyl transferase component Bud32